MEGTYKEDIPPSLYVPLLHLSVMLMRSLLSLRRHLVANPVEGDHFWFTSCSISEPMSINVHSGTIVPVKYSTANKAGCHALGLG